MSSAENVADELALKRREKREGKRQDGKQQEGAPNFSRSDTGTIKNTVNNILLGLSAIGVTLRYNEFTMRALISGPNNKIERVLQDEDISNLVAELGKRFSFHP